MNPNDLMKLAQQKIKDASDAGSSFDQKAAALAKYYHLSAREQDVFMYLAKGHGAKSICTKLFISEATVRSHRYNIYNKLDIHSQQELIDMVDSFKEA